MGQRVEQSCSNSAVSQGAGLIKSLVLKHGGSLRRNMRIQHAVPAHFFRRRVLHTYLRLLSAMGLRFTAKAWASASGSSGGGGDASSRLPARPDRETTRESKSVSAGNHGFHGGGSAPNSRRRWCHFKASARTETETAAVT